MTVKELIEELSKYPDNYDVLMSGDMEYNINKVVLQNEANGELRDEFVLIY